MAAHSLSTSRPARRGELCTCGRQATTVIVAAETEVGWCGTYDAPQVRPCRFCGEDIAHQGRCPQYRLHL
ncbi:MAG TPA: hypothetical protein VIA06_11025 [Candidatus Dormibacteraeota bacterium]|jgi:hypothetical protein|nr:hypothetical protein [Candidatus Dormibacteraeota bacterium]